MSYAFHSMTISQKQWVHQPATYVVAAWVTASVIWNTPYCLWNHEYKIHLN